MLTVLMLSLISDLVESRLTTPSGKIERIVSKGDERDFSVKLTRSDGKVEWLETVPAKFFSSDERVFRRRLSDEVEEVALESFGEIKTLGRAYRIFEKAKNGAEDFSCHAIARVNFPTPLSETADLLIAALKCKNKIPQTATQKFSVIGKANQSWTQCDAAEESCVFHPRKEIEAEASAQVSALAFLWTVEKTLKSGGISPFMLPLTAKSWSTNANTSSYDAGRRTLSYGAGDYVDANDGFVVVHEWGHALIDDLNPGLYDEEARALHEGIADFIASDTFGSACFAPFDAQEVPNRKCVRDLAVDKFYPNDWEEDNPHQSSLILSGALWKARELLPPGLAMEMSLEAMIRLSKTPTFRNFWDKFVQVYERILSERPNLKNLKAEISEIGRKHGLTQIN